MKNKFKKIIIIFLIMITSMVSFSCLKQGESAYDIAVRNGFVGTETEWLESLKGDDGENGLDGKDRVLLSLYTDLKESGEFTGTFTEFVQEYILKFETNGSTKGAINLALRSVVSIVANFTQIVETQLPYGQVTTDEKKYSGSGSGVIYKLDDKGNAYIITNYHVIYDKNCNAENYISNDITCFVYGSHYVEFGIPATYIGGAMEYDVAILKVTENKFLRDSGAVECKVADSNEVAVGQTAFAIGNAEGMGISATTGIVSVESEYITMTLANNSTRASMRVMRIDTAINSGNSGGGLFDMYGNLIGITNAKIIDTSVENIGYALCSTPVTYIADNVIRQYEQDGQVHGVLKFLLGITVTPKSSKMQYNADIEKTLIIEEVMIVEVTSTSIAKDILLANDVITSATINGKTIQINRYYQIVEFMLTAKLGDTVSLTILRDNVPLTVSFITTMESSTTLK